MSFKKRRLTLTTDASGDASGTLGLGAAYALIRGIKIDFSASAAAGTDVTIIDADSRAVYDSTDANTDIDVPLAADSTGYDGDANTAAEGVAPMVFKSPLTVTVAQGGASKVNVFDLFVEV